MSVLESRLLAAFLSGCGFTIAIGLAAFCTINILAAVGLFVFSTVGAALAAYAITRFRD